MATLEDIDRTLADLQARTERLGEGLLELELDGDRKLLDGGRLEGETALRWSAAATNLLAAWDAHAQLTATLERAAELRSARGRVRKARLDELEELLGGRDELLGSALASAAEAADVVRDAGRAWESLTPRLDAAGAAIDAAGLEAPRAQYEALRAALAADPLAVDPTAVDELDRAIDAAQRELAEIAGLRGEAQARLAAARALLDQVEEVQRDGETAHQLALAKIADPQVTAPRHALTDLDAGLRSVESLVSQESWAAARDALAEWTREATVELEVALSVAAQNRAPLERRNQLRGLLKAYQAKARGVRALEEPAIALLFEQAERALYTAPADLDAATALVGRYQRALARYAAEREVVR